MFFFYEILAITFLLFSPIIFAVRIIIGKEDFNRFLEKFCIYKKYNKDQTIWFHGASVGEIMSIIPIIKILEKNNKVQKIFLSLVTLFTSEFTFVFFSPKYFRFPAIFIFFTPSLLK